MGRYAVQSVVIVNPQGFHLRPAHAFVQLASQFASQIRLTKDAETIDGKSILSILTLGAGQGTTLRLEAEGDDAERAVEALAELVAQGFYDEEAEESTI